MNFYKLIALFCVAFALNACESDKVLLAFNTHDVVPQIYRLDASLNAILPEDSLGSPEAMNSKLSVVATNTLLTAYDDGSAKFQIKIDSVDYKSDKRSVEEFSSMERYMLNEHFQFKMASDGAVRDPYIEDSAMVGSDVLNFVKLFLKIQPLLPGKAVNVGEKWEREVEIPGPSGNTVVYKSFTLEETFVHDGIRMAKIQFNLKYREIADSTSDLQMSSNGFIVGTGTIIFDIAHGIISNIKMELSGDIGINDIVAGSVIPNMHVVQRITLRSEL